MSVSDGLSRFHCVENSRVVRHHARNVGNIVRFGELHSRQAAEALDHTANVAAFRNLEPVGSIQAMSS